MCHFDLLVAKVTGKKTASKTFRLVTNPCFLVRLLADHDLWLGFWGSNWTHKEITPRNLTWNVKRNPLRKRKLLLETIMFRFHAKFQGSRITSWWLNHTSEKIYARQIGSFPQGFGVKKKYLKPPGITLPTFS